MNQLIYIMVLEYVLLPGLSQVSATLGDVAFQHVNIPIHTAGNVADRLVLMGVDVDNHS